MKQNEQPKDKDRVQFFSVRRGWVGTALLIFCALISVYGGMAINYHLSKGWTGYETLRAIVVDTTGCIPTALAIPVLILFLFVEVPMILYGLIKEQIERRQKIREAIGEAIGEARGEARGRELANREWAEWETRRRTAEAAGDDFTEPTPAEKRNEATQQD